MKLLIVRHGDPDYEHDTLTERGWVEAEYLAEKMKNIEAKAYYVSPLGRAKDTASLTLKAVGREAEECWWLEEFFRPQIHRPDNTNGTSIAWDWLPGDWTQYPDLFDRNAWKENPIMKEGSVGEAYDKVCAAFDELLAKHGYVREGDVYKTEQGNNDTIVFFCHLGLECVLLSHLIGTSPMIFWQGFAGAPTSVTTVVTEERRKGTASFRITQFGSVEHLYVKGMEPSFAARFRETYENDWERLD